MIKLRDLILENSNDLVYHLTKKSNLPSIKKHGLKPSLPVDTPTDDEGVYVFKTKQDAEDALMNWYGDRFDEEEEFVLLTIKTDGLQLFSTLAEFELVSYTPIPTSNILKIEDI